MEHRMLELRAKLDDASCTVQELIEYCMLAFPPRPGMWLQEADYFVQPDSMQAFTWLKGWWRMDTYPQSLPEPNLLAFLWGIYVPLNEDGTGPAHHVTLNDGFMQFINRARAWCQANNIDPDNMSETAEDRRKRKARERMAAARAGRKVPDKAIPDDTIRAQVRDIEAQIDAIKVIAKAEDEMHRQDVVNFQQQMIAASEARKAAAQQHKEAIDKLRSDIKNLTAKQ